MTSRQGRLLSRNYALAAIGSGLPFLLVVLVLAVYQFTVQRQQLLAELEDDAVTHNLLLGGILNNVQGHVRSLHSWAGAYLARADAAPGGAVPESASWREAGARLVVAGPDEPPGDLMLRAGGELVPHMRLAHQAMPYLRWSWLVDADARAMTLFPVFTSSGPGTNRRRDGGLELLALIRGGGLMPEGTSASAASVESFWTRPHLDPAARSWAIAYAAPVDHEDARVGLVGTSVLLEFLTGFLRAFDYTAGRTWLVDAEGHVLAASEGSSVVGARLRTLDEILPPDLADRPAEVLASSAGLSRIGDSYVLTQPVGGSTWRFLYVADAGEINRVLWPRFTPYGVILAALIVTLLLAHQLRERLIIRPALGLVEYIRAESQDESPERPRLPPVWQPWVDAVAGAFAAKRLSVEQIRDDAERLEALAGAHPVPVAIVPLDDTRLAYANRAFADLFRMRPEDLPGTDVRGFYDSPRGRAAFLKRLRRHGHIRGFEGTGRRSDGTVFPASLTSHLIRFEGRDAVVTAVIDLTEQKAAEAEIARQREALHQSEKLNALGSMLASVAHELNNPLSVVVGYATMMRDLALDQPTKDRAARIHAAAERCARIVRTFLAMARRKPESRDPLQIGHVIEAALEIAGYGLRTADVTVDVDIAPDLPEVYGDPDQLALVVMNLIVNAQHALQTAPMPRRLEIAAARSGDRVRLEVRDNGPGIAAEVRERVFEPFFTTKPQGVGTGIGLSVCRNIVLAHDGEIEVLDAPGGGSLFRITLPAGAAQPVPPPAAAPPRSSPVRGRILIVEDEEEVAEMLTEMLRRDGHEVEIAESGREALGRLEARPVDLIISDLHMPDLDGPELYRSLVERQPELAGRMVFMTGDVLAADLDGFLSQTGVPVFDKPIDPYDIRTKVKDRLERLAAGRI